MRVLATRVVARSRLCVQGYLVSPFLAYNFSELIESHAVDTYTEFAEVNKELLQSLPPTPQVGVRGRQRREGARSGKGGEGGEYRTGRPHYAPDCRPFEVESSSLPSHPQQTIPRVAPCLRGFLFSGLVVLFLSAVWLSLRRGGMLLSVANTLVRGVNFIFSVTRGARS